jgi:plastocyanin
MSTMRIAMVLSVFSVLAVGLSMGPALVHAQGLSISIVPDAATLGDKAYSPNPSEVKVGDTVTWTNDDTQIHTAVSGISPAVEVPAGSNQTQGPDGLFDSGVLTPKQSFEFTFDQASPEDGYAYYCTLHPQMVGTIKVSN